MRAADDTAPFAKRLGDRAHAARRSQVGVVGGHRRADRLPPLLGHGRALPPGRVGEVGGVGRHNQCATRPERRLEREAKDKQEREAAAAQQRSLDEAEDAAIVPLHPANAALEMQPIGSPHARAGLTPVNLAEGNERMIAANDSRMPATQVA